MRHVPDGGLARPAWLLAWTLVLAMVLAPLLGQMHRVVHLGSIAGLASDAPRAGQPASDWVHALFDSHGPAGCQLLDQHHDGLAGPSAAPVLPLPCADRASPAPRAAVRDGRMLGAFFLARAPPLPITAALKA